MKYFKLDVYNFALVAFLLFIFLDKRVFASDNDSKVIDVDRINENLNDVALATDQKTNEDEPSGEDDKEDDKPILTVEESLPQTQLSEVEMTEQAEDPPPPTLNKSFWEKYEFSPPDYTVPQLHEQIYALTEARCRSMQNIRISSPMLNSKHTVISALTTTDSFKAANVDEFMSLNQLKSDSSYIKKYGLYASHKHTRPKDNRGVPLALVIVDRRTRKTTIYFKHDAYPAGESRIVLVPKPTGSKLFVKFFGLELTTPCNVSTKDNPKAVITYGLKCRRLLARFIPFNWRDVCEISDKYGKKVSKIQQGSIRSLMSSLSLDVVSFKNFFKFFHYDSAIPDDSKSIPCYVQSLVYLLVKRGIY